jgi:16S rRNA (cytidine1402-2'-O)-methyltransferase
MLSIVATPIGNLGDITLRALETFKAVSAIVCEDTRVTGGLLHQLELPKKELISLHGYTDPHKLDNVITRLVQGEHMALTCDAGTPGISDPGYQLVSRCREQGIKIRLPLCTLRFWSPDQSFYIPWIFATEERTQNDDRWICGD